MARWLRLCRLKVRGSLIGGVAILLLVDVIWVGSAGLTRFLFTKESYEKPFFTTYFKTCLFSIYLVAFLFWRPWQQQCWRDARLFKCGRKKGTIAHVTHDEGQKPQHLAADETQQQCSIQQEEGDDQLNSPSMDDSGIFTGTICDEFPPGRGSTDSKNKNQTLPNIVVSNHRDCCTASSPAPTACPTIDYSCHKGHTYTPSHCPVEGEDREVAGLDSDCKESDEYGEGPLPEREKLLPSAVDTSCSVVQQRKVFDVPSLSGSVNHAVCPIRPKMDVCLLGPPEYEPLGCYESDDDRDRSLSTPLPPCRQRCCKVRFKPTIEIRERMGSDCRSTLQRRDTGPTHNNDPIKPLSVCKVMGVAFVFGILWFFANYLYAKGLEKTSVAAVNTISASSGVLVMILAAVPILSVTDGDKFTLTRLVVTLISFGGAIMVSLSPSGLPEDEDNKEFNYGAIFALGGAVFEKYLICLYILLQIESILSFYPHLFYSHGYALYLVLLKKVIKHHEALDIPMFFGFVGLFDCFLLLPLLLIWDVSGLEKFNLPPSANVWTLLLVNGFVGTVLSELLWLWAVFLTSPLLGTLALSLVTPLSITYSIVVGKCIIEETAYLSLFVFTQVLTLRLFHLIRFKVKSFPRKEASFSLLFFFGAVLIIVAFIGVTVLDHFGAWDPLWIGMKKLFVMAKDASHHRGFRSLSPESQRLITSEQPHCDHDYLIT